MTLATRGSARATSTAAMDMFALTPRTQVVVMVVVGWMKVVIVMMILGMVVMAAMVVMMEM